jgi:hypothetical protein
MCQGYQTIKQNPFLVKREAYFAIDEGRRSRAFASCLNVMTRKGDSLTSKEPSRYNCQIFQRDFTSAVTGFCQ